MQQIAGRFRKDGHAVADGARVFLVVDARRERVRWYGSFLLPATAPLRKPGPYYLELADGRHGQVLVSRVRPMQCGHVGGFTGQGPLMGAADVTEDGKGG